MTKKKLLLWLSLTVLLFSSISVYAEAEYEAEFVEGRYFNKNIIINGERIVNHNLQYALFTYNEVLYIPLTPEMCEIYGVSAEMDWENRTLTLLKTEPARKNISANWLKNDRKDVFAEVIREVAVFAYAPAGEPEELDVKDRPPLSRNGWIYLPLRVFAESAVFNWDIYFNGYYGACVSTISGVPAQAYQDKAEEDVNKGLVEHIRRYSPDNVIYAQELLFSFKSAGEVFGVDPKLLMAMAQRESKFNTLAVGRGGAAGMMQVMPATGVQYGLSSEQLKDPRTAIDFAAMYMSQRITAYNGDWISALSAYNQGSTRVNRGTHSTWYANDIMAAYGGIDNFLNAFLSADEDSPDN